MFKEPEGYGYSPFKYWAAMVGVIATFVAVFGLGFWVLETTGEHWLLTLLCGLSGVVAVVVLRAHRNGS